MIGQKKKKPNQTVRICFVSLFFLSPCKTMTMLTGFRLPEVGVWGTDTLVDICVQTYNFLYLEITLNTEWNSIIVLYVVNLAVS